MGWWVLQRGAASAGLPAGGCCTAVAPRHPCPPSPLTPRRITRAPPDADWCTKFEWGRHWQLSEYSFATISWHVPPSAAPGTYRLTHYGDYKHLLGTVHPFEGSSSEFRVAPPPGVLARWGHALGQFAARAGIHWLTAQRF